MLNSWKQFQTADWLAWQAANWAAFQWESSMPPSGANGSDDEAIFFFDDIDER